MPVTAKPFAPKPGHVHRSLAHGIIAHIMGEALKDDPDSEEPVDVIAECARYIHGDDQVAFDNPEFLKQSANMFLGLDIEAQELRDQTFKVLANHGVSRPLIKKAKTALQAAIPLQTLHDASKRYDGQVPQVRNAGETAPIDDVGITLRDINTLQSGLDTLGKLFTEVAQASGQKQPVDAVEALFRAEKELENLQQHIIHIRTKTLRL